MNKRKEDCNNHISRMTEDKIVRFVRCKSPKGRKSPGLPRRVWNVSVPLHKQAVSLCARDNNKKIVMNGVRFII
jgi:hypothetical protein